jgi:hypothetical protein
MVILNMFCANHAKNPVGQYHVGLRHLFTKTSSSTMRPFSIGQRIHTMIDDEEKKAHHYN